MILTVIHPNSNALYHHRRMLLLEPYLQCLRFKSPNRYKQTAPPMRCMLLRPRHGNPWIERLPNRPHKHLLLRRPSEPRLMHHEH